MAKEEEVQRIMDSTIQQFGQLDVLVRPRVLVYDLFLLKGGGTQCDITPEIRTLNEMYGPLS